jgi:hypothetical protein
LHFNATAHPTSDWVVQQLREGSAAFPVATGTSCSTVTRSSAAMYSGLSRPAVLSPFARACAVRGRTEWPSAGLGAGEGNAGIPSD